MLRKLVGLLGESSKALNEFVSDMDEGVRRTLSVQEATRELTIAVRVERSIFELAMTNSRLLAKFDEPSAISLQSRKFYEDACRSSRSYELPDAPLANFDLLIHHPDLETEQAIRDAIDDIRETRDGFLRKVVQELNGNSVMKKHFLNFLEKRGAGKYLIPLREAGLNR